MDRRKLIAAVMGGKAADPILFSDSFSAALSASWTNVVGTFETNTGKARAATIAVDGNNLISNGEFTTNLTGWTKGNAAYGFERVDCTSSPDIDPTGGADEFAAKTTAPDEFGAFAYQNFNPILNATYTATCRAYAPAANTGKASIRLVDNNSATSQFTAGEDAWETITVTRKMITSIPSDPIRIGLHGGALNDISYIDKVVCNANVSISVFNATVSDMDITVTITTPGSLATPFGIVLRVTDASNYWLVRITPGTAGNDLELVEVNGGVSTVRAAADIDWTTSTDYVLNVRAYTNKYSVKVAGVEKLSYTDSGNFGIAATNAGLFDMGASNGLFDDLEVRPVSPFDLPSFSLVSTQTLWSGSGVTDWLGRPNMCKTAAGVWVTTYRQAIGHTDDTNSLIHLRFSTNEGVSWTEADTFTDGSACTGAPIGGHSGGSAGEGLIWLAPNGDLLINVFEDVPFGTYQYRSTDSGKTWTDEGVMGATIIGAQGVCVVGSDIYMGVLIDANADTIHPWLPAVYKSSNNGTTWAKLADVYTLDDGNEIGIVNPQGNRLVIVMRHQDSDTTTFQFRSDDLGVTWSAREDIGALVGIMHKPHLLKLRGGGVLLYGRDATLAPDETIVVYYSHDGVWWSRGFHPETTAQVDCGYCDVLERNDGTFYMLSYKGDFGTASIVEYVFRLG